MEENKLKLNILSLIKERRTVRKYKNKELPHDILNKILEAARWAPSPHNTQPWKFVITRNRDSRKKLLEILNKSSDKLLSGARILLQKNVEIINNAPTLVLVYNKAIFSKRIQSLGKPYTSIVHISEIESIGAAIQNMHLIAAALDIGMAWLVFPLLLKKEINKLLKTKDELVAVLTLGFPDEKPPEIRRKRLEEIVEVI